MASVQQKGDGWYCQFVFKGKRHTFAIGKVTRTEAEAKAAQVDYLLLRLKERLATIPPGMEIVDYVRYDGKPDDRVTASRWGWRKPSRSARCATGSSQRTNIL